MHHLTANRYFPHMASMDKKHDTVSLRMTREERQALEDYRASNGLRSLNAAMCHLIAAAARKPQGQTK